ncbi:hypothetical protein [Methylobacterium planeticum]|uniref:Uncharacterized protein n=1 Tax=Methylobacterium planeticum TaxID=2615211 RepID=A0A6N6MQS2_9HYPH|nr:hypothetical protein [Methylobacterium planeticum]KAB1073994.1 hypothetical protein F6X51_09755 [Methylobacterium planeticum]
MDTPDDLTQARIQAMEYLMQITLLRLFRAGALDRDALIGEAQQAAAGMQVAPAERPVGEALARFLAEL